MSFQCPPISKLQLMRKTANGIETLGRFQMCETCDGNKPKPVYSMQHSSFPGKFRYVCDNQDCPHFLEYLKDDPKESFLLIDN